MPSEKVSVVEDVLTQRDRGSLAAPGENPIADPTIPQGLRDGVGQMEHLRKVRPEPDEGRCKEAYAR